MHCPKELLIPNAFTPNGDGTYDNGAYSRAQYPGKEGLGIEATVQSPVNRPNAQRFSLMITAIAQATPSGPAGVGCSVRNPTGDGWSYLHYMGVTDAILPVADELTSDKPYRVRLQLFPDGTCGTAINGHARHRSKPQVRPELMYSFMIKGESVGTQILVGPLTMWRGVRGDVDWDVLTRDTTAAGQRIKRP